MGQSHFIQMHADAVAVDIQAMPIFLDLVASSHEADAIEKGLYGSTFWESMPTDVIMEHARGLVHLGEQYHTDLKQLLVEGKMAVTVIDRSGRPIRVKDPRIIDFDDIVVSPTAFFHMMMNMPDELCSGDQNA